MYSRPQCDCNKDETLPYCDSAKYWIFYIKERTNTSISFEHANELYEKYLYSALSEKISEKLIMCDIENTFSATKYFNREQGTHGLTLLKHVLSAVAMYRPKLEYVTGMNYIAACLLYHTCPYVAFWIMVNLIDLYKLDEVYEVGSPGLILHSKIIEKLLFSQEEAKEDGSETTVIRMVCNEWATSLFMSAVPLETSVITKIINSLYY